MIRSDSSLPCALVSQTSRWTIPLCSAQICRLAPRAAHGRSTRLTPFRALKKDKEHTADSIGHVPESKSSFMPHLPDPRVPSTTWSKPNRWQARVTHTYHFCAFLIDFLWLMSLCLCNHHQYRPFQFRTHSSAHHSFENSETSVKMYFTYHRKVSQHCQPFFAPTPPGNMPPVVQHHVFFVYRTHLCLA